MNYSEIEKLYSPSVWSKRQNVIENHIKFAVTETENNRKSIPCILNIPYGNRERQKLDIYGIDLPNQVPIFIYIHGGYWQELSKDNSGYVVSEFYKNKIKTIIIGYTLCPEISLQEIILEIETAIKKCIEIAKENDCRSIYLSGYSAGSHLIACIFSNLFPQLTEIDRSLFKAAILCCGIYDLTPLINTYINKPLNLNYDTAKSLSPMYQKIDKLNLLVHVVVGENDSPAFKKQSEEYYTKIKLATSSTFKIIEEVDHFSIVERYNCKDYELVKLILSLNEFNSINK